MLKWKEMCMISIDTIHKKNEEFHRKYSIKYESKINYIKKTAEVGKLQCIVVIINLPSLLHYDIYFI